MVLEQEGVVIVQGRDYTEDEGLYTPMAPLPLPVYHVLDTETKQQQQQSTPDTPDNHYYRLDVGSYIPY